MYILCIYYSILNGKYVCIYVCNVCKYVLMYVYSMYMLFYIK